MHKRVADMSEEERKRARARDRSRYKRRRAQLLADPVAYERYREKARENVRRHRERHAERIAADRRARAKQRYAQDESYRAKLVRKQREYVEKNRQLVYQRNREYYARNRDRRNAQNKAWRRANIDRILPKERERNRAKYDEDPAAVNRYNREWRKRNPEKARLYLRVSNHKRRAAAGSAHWTRDEWLALLERYGGRCHYCGADGRMDADHRIPLSRGGSNTIENIVPACKSCNCSKNDRTEEEFWQYLAERERVGRKSA